MARPAQPAAPPTGTTLPTATFPVTGDADADALLVTNPFALLLGMLLDQQVPMEWAFRSPARLAERLGDRPLDPVTVAALDPTELLALFTGPPALHRFPKAMAERTHVLAAVLVDTYGGDTAALWQTATTGAEELRRLRELPGFGEEKARIFVAVLAKRFGHRPRGWKAAAGPFADSTPRSVADIGSREAFTAVRAWKKAQKAKGLSKAD